jgi:hypothetical protein
MIGAITAFPTLTETRQAVKDWLKFHPVALKVVLIANHFLRTAPMFFLMASLPFSFAVNAALCAAGSLFYTLTIEGNCIYKFTLPSLFGGCAWMAAQTSLSSAVSGAAFASIKAFAAASALALPIAAWSVYVLHSAAQDAEATRATRCCQ